MTIARLVACLVLAASCAGRGQGAAPENGAKDAASAPADAGAAPAAPSHRPAHAAPSGLDAERRADEVAYQFVYLPEQRRLAAERRGEWVAIVAGKVLPAKGARVDPAGTMEEAVAAAVAAAPAAKHRFVFQVGEEGDVDWPMGGCELKHVVGTGFLKSLYADERQLKMEGLGPGEEIQALFDGAFRQITVKGQDDRMYLKPEVGAPGAAGAASEIYCISTGFAGCATMTPATAAASGLDLWEIPGAATVFGSGPDAVRCRRARARFRWSGSQLDFTLPVAIWSN
jgi:hypothetical protein